MLAADCFFGAKEANAQVARKTLWKNFFQPLFPGYKAQYQSCDFESVDYQLYRALPGGPLARGPRPALPDLMNGRYVTVFGAAQLFGRHHKRAPHHYFEKKLGMPGVNLAKGGSGPEYFARKEYIQVANGGRALVLQMLSGRSVGSDEQPGGRFISEPDNPDEKTSRLKFLRETWEKSPDEAVQMVSKWQQNYIELFKNLIREVKVPILLVWISDRTPDDWSLERLRAEGDTGRYPQLVDRKMVNEVARECAAVVEVSQDLGLPHEFTSRFTGERCPCFRPKGLLFWENSYYPSAVASAEIGRKIAKALEAMNIPR